MTTAGGGGDDAAAVGSGGEEEEQSVAAPASMAAPARTSTSLSVFLGELKRWISSLHRGPALHMPSPPSFLSLRILFDSNSCLLLSCY